MSQRDRQTAPAMTYNGISWGRKLKFDLENLEATTHGPASKIISSFIFKVVFNEEGDTYIALKFIHQPLNRAYHARGLPSIQTWGVAKWSCSITPWEIAKWYLHCMYFEKKNSFDDAKPSHDLPWSHCAMNEEITGVRNLTKKGKRRKRRSDQARSTKGKGKRNFGLTTTRSPLFFARGFWSDMRRARIILTVQNEGASKTN